MASVRVGPGLHIQDMWQIEEDNCQKGTQCGRSSCKQCSCYRGELGLGLGFLLS